MSYDERTALPDDSNQSLAVSSPTAMEPHDNGWNRGGLAAAAASEDPLAKVAPYLHGLRRHSALAFGLGLLMVAIVAPLVWLSQTDEYTAKAYLRVSSTEKRIAFATQGEIRTDFDLYRSTQQELLTSPFVLMAALRDPALTNLSVIKEEENPLAMLAREVRVGFPGDSEIMEVRFTADNPEEATAVVNAVVQAYRDEVVDVERVQKRERLSELDRVFAAKETQVRAKRTDLKELATRLGTGQEDALNLKQENALEVYAAFRREQMRVQFEMLRARGELQAQQALLKNFDAQKVSGLELAMYADQDPIVQQLAQQLAWIQADYMYSQSQVRPGAATPYLERYGRDYALAQQQYEAQQQRLRDELVMHTQMSIEDQIEELNTQIAVLEAQNAAIQQDVEDARAEAEKYGVQSIDVEMARAEIEQLERVLAELATERERLRVEVNSEARVTLIQSADEPRSPDSSMRIPLTVLASLAAFGLPLVGIALWDVRGKRINSSRDVSDNLGLPVIGSVPKIPPRIIKRLAKPTQRHQRWRMQLTESVDGIVAQLLRKAALEDTRSVLVTSPVRGEGKTTMATQIALSLVRNGHRVLLMDCDMRRPALNDVFGLPAEPGVSECLRGDARVEDAVRETATDGLHVLPAGRWDRQVMAALAKGASAGLLNELRAEYDFVVIDSCPVLPVADTRYISQHVDMVLLSVLRDTSDLPSVQSSFEILTAFGVENIETAVTGGNGDLYSKSLQYDAEVEA